MQRLLAVEGWCGESARELAAIASDGRAEWQARCAAILGIEHLLLRLPADSGEAGDFLRGIGCEQHWQSLRPRLARLNRVHGAIREYPADFLHTARQECKLTLAPYFLKPAEVAARILSQLRWSGGIPYWKVGLDQTNPALTSYEQAIIDELQLGGQIYWVNDGTPSTINSLVEYPLGTVVLVLKLPGSDCEFELKRGGIRGKEPLSVKYFRAAHRLYGGSPGTSNDVEARSALRLADVFRSVHGENPQINSTISMSYVQTVPGRRGEEHLLTYLTDAEAFGPGYGAMREAMEDAVGDFEDHQENGALTGTMGVTVRFLRYMPPRQALLKGSTAFRLDLLDDYFSADGARKYFEEGLGQPFDCDDARRFANDLLEEVLGVVEAPAGGAASYAEYLRQALAVPANRARADRLYLAHMRYTGKFWGTIFACGGTSRGESFVPRNVGLKARFTGTEWASEIVFMDHDCLRVPGAEFPFDPWRTLSPTNLDEGYLFEDEDRGERSRGVEGCLRRIYAVSQPVRGAGLQAFRAAVRDAYWKTRRAMKGAAFRSGFAERVELWESLVRSLLEALDRGETAKEWDARGNALLEAAGQGPRICSQWTGAAVRSAELLRRYGFVFTEPR